MPRINQVSVGRDVMRGGSVGRQRIAAPVEAFGASNGLQNVGRGLQAVGGGIERRAEESERKAERDRLIAEKKAEQEQAEKNKSDISVHIARATNLLGQARLNGKQANDETQVAEGYNNAWREVDKLEEAIESPTVRTAIRQWRAIEMERRSTEGRALQMDASRRNTIDNYNQSIQLYKENVVDYASAKEAINGINKTIDAVPTNIMPDDKKEINKKKEIAEVERTLYSQELSNLSNTPADELDLEAEVLKGFISQSKMPDIEKKKMESDVDIFKSKIVAARDAALEREISDNKDNAILSILGSEKDINDRQQEFMLFSSGMKEKYGERANKAISIVEKAVNTENQRTGERSDLRVRTAYLNRRSADAAKAVLTAEIEAGNIGGEQAVKSLNWIAKQKADEIDEDLKLMVNELDEAQKAGELRKRDAQSYDMSGAPLPLRAADWLGSWWDEEKINGQEYTAFIDAYQKQIKADGITDPVRKKQVMDAILKPVRSTKAIYQYEGETLEARIQDLNRQLNMKAQESTDKAMRRAKQEGRSKINLPTEALIKILESQEAELQDEE